MKLSPAPMVSVGSTTTGCDPVTLAVALYKSAARSARDDGEGDPRGEGVEGLFEGAVGLSAIFLISSPLGWSRSIVSKRMGRMLSQLPKGSSLVSSERVCPACLR